MSDWLIVRISDNNPNKVEVVEVLANVPSNWKRYLQKVAKQKKKCGRYIAANLLYGQGDAFYPSRLKKKIRKTEKQSGD